MRILDKNRNKYKKVYDNKDACIFCANLESLVCQNIKNEYWQIIVNRYPYMDGNVMIVPKRHMEKISEITKDEWASFGEILSKTQEALCKIFEADSYNIGLNAGPQSGASIEHLHWQLIPRNFKNITAMNAFADLYIVKTTPEETKRKLEKYFKKQRV